ncbi:(2Fe-2S)-binding protein [Paraburkholderia sediminicola]|uniref:(2Fe-2S)-binding protein n=1 Tax=Paraburkholderia TaxID=1822464 RepID=UPI0038B98C3C
MIQLSVNGVTHSIEVDASMPLLYALRNRLNLNGAKFGCGLGQCGACTVIVGDRPVFSCLLPVSAVGSRNVRTIEGLGSATSPNALQAAFIKHQAAQCGYCIAGMIMRAQALLDKNPHPTEIDLRAHMEFNLCRCGTHMRILAAIREVAGTSQEQAPSSQRPKLESSDGQMR